MLTFCPLSFSSVLFVLVQISLAESRIQLVSSLIKSESYDEAKGLCGSATSELRSAGERVDHLFAADLDRAEDVVGVFDESFLASALAMVLDSLGTSLFE